jgi:hypothetical protein
MDRPEDGVVAHGEDRQVKSRLVLGGESACCVCNEDRVIRLGDFRHWPIFYFGELF